MTAEPPGGPPRPPVPPTPLPDATRPTDIPPGIPPEIPPDIQWRRLNPAYLVLSGGRALRSLLPVLAVGVWRIPGWTIGAVAVLVAAYAVASWWTRRYRVADGVFSLQGGIFTRSVHTVPTARITAVDTSRGALQRLLRVWTVDLHTAAEGAGQGVKLHCLTTRDVARLRAALAVPGLRGADARPPGSGPHDRSGAPDRSPSVPGTADPAPAPLARLDRRSLAVATVTGVSIPVLFAGAAAAWDRVHALIPRETMARVEAQIFGPGSATVLILVALALLAVLGGSLLTAQRMAGFTLLRDGPVLRTSRGLFSQHTATVTVARVQAVRVVEGVLRRPFGLCALEVEVAGGARSEPAQRVLFPLLRTADVADLVHQALPELGWRPVPLHGVPRRARRRYLTVPGCWGAAVTVSLAAWLPLPWAWGALLPLPLALLLGWTRARHAGWAVDPETVTVRGFGVLARATVVATRRRVQTTQRSTTWFQRRAGLASVSFTLASRRRAGIRYLDSRDAGALVAVLGRRAPRRPGRGPHGGLDGRSDSGPDPRPARTATQLSVPGLEVPDSAPAAGTPSAPAPYRGSR